MWRCRVLGARHRHCVDTTVQAAYRRSHPLIQELRMADDKREKRGVIAKWRDRRADRVEQAAQKPDGRPRVKQARDDAASEWRDGRRVPRP
jgi:hypothetical protein